MAENKSVEENVKIEIGGETFSTADSPNRLVNKYIEIAKIAEDRFKKAEDLAKSASASAEQANDKKVGLLSGKKDAIEGLQGAVLNQASLSENIVELNGLHLKMIQELAKISKATVYVSTVNLAYARQMQEELLRELKDEETSEGERHDAVIKSIKDTLNDITQSINLMEKQEQQRRKIKDLYHENDDQDEIINRLDQENDEQDLKLQQQMQQDRAHDQKIQALYQENDDQDELINRLDTENDEQDLKLQHQAQADRAHEQNIQSLYKENDDQDEIIQRLDEENDEQDLEMQRRVQQDKEHAQKIQSLYKENDDQDEIIRRLDEENDRQDEEVAKQAKRNQIYDQKIGELDQADQKLKSAIENQKKSLVDSQNKEVAALQLKLKRQEQWFIGVTIILVIAIITSFIF